MLQDCQDKSSVFPGLWLLGWKIKQEVIVLDRALEGLLFLEVAEGWSAGSLIGRLVVELGGQLIKVEMVRGDTLRREGPLLKPGVSCAFQLVNGGKRSLKLDLDNPDDQKALLQLAKRADAIIVDRRYPGLEKLELNLVLPENENLICCYISPFGLSGPLSKYFATDLIVQAMSGVMATTGLSDGTPLRAGLPLTEHVGAVFGASAVLAALEYRNRTGRGQTIDLSLYDCLVGNLGNFLPDYYLGGQVPKRRGNRHNVAPWNTFPAKDGYVVICLVSDVQWDGFLEIIGRKDLLGDERYNNIPDRFARIEEVERIVAEWTCEHTVQEIYRQLIEHNLPAAPIYSIEDLFQDEHLLSRGLLDWHEDLGGKVPVSGILFKMSKSPGRTCGLAPELGQDNKEIFNQLRSVPAKGISRVATRKLILNKEMGPPEALKGLRVLEIGSFTAGPYAGRQLANLGAEVIKIEPLNGEDIRRVGRKIGQESILYHITNNDKKSLSLNLNSLEGQQIIKDLVRNVDIFIENFPAGSLKKWNLEYEVLSAINPRLIYCSINGFGQSGPYANRRAFDTVIQAMSGIMSLTGETEGIPLKVGLSVADFLGASFGVANILTAVYYRRRTGQGQHLDVSMHDIAVWITEDSWPVYLVEGQVPPKTGNRIAHHFLSGVFQTLDGLVAIDIETEENWPKFVRAMGYGLELDKPSLAGSVKSLEYSQEIEDLVAGWLREATVDQITASCQRVGIPAGPVLDLAAISDHPHTRFREMLVERTHPEAGLVKLIGTPYKMSETPGRVHRVGPRLGENNDEILVAILNYDQKRIAELRERGILK